MNGLAPLIEKVNTRLLILEETLLEEKRLLDVKDMRSLPRVTQQKHLLLDHIEQLTISVNEGLQPLGITSDQVNVNTIFNRLPECQALNNQWQQFIEVSKRCYSLNKSNGDLINTHSRQIHELMRLLRNPDDEETYSMTKATTGAAHGRSLGSV